VPAPKAERFEQACREFEGDREFEKHPPTREQLARAWALAKFKKTHPSQSPDHSELVAALKKLFPEFKPAKPASKPPAPGKPEKK